MSCLLIAFAAAACAEPIPDAGPDATSGEPVDGGDGAKGIASFGSGDGALPVVTDVLGKFRAMSTTGTVTTLIDHANPEFAVGLDDAWPMDDYHFQGIQRLYDSPGRDLAISESVNAGVGNIIFFKDNVAVDQVWIGTGGRWGAPGADPLPHAGGMQALGKLLFAGTETMDNDVSEVWAVDTSSPVDPVLGPNKYKLIDRPADGAAYVAVAYLPPLGGAVTTTNLFFENTYMMVVAGQAGVEHDVYVKRADSDGLVRGTIDETPWVKIGCWADGGGTSTCPPIQRESFVNGDTSMNYQSANLVTQQDGTVFLVGFSGDRSFAGDDTNYIDVWRVIWPGSNMHVSGALCTGSTMCLVKYLKKAVTDTNLEKMFESGGGLFIRDENLTVLGVDHDPQDSFTPHHIRFNTFAGTRRLTVNASNGGASSSPAGIDGVATSTYFIDGSTVDLTPDADDWYRFDGWSGCSSQTGDVCHVLMSSDKTVTPRFVPRSYAMRISKVPQNGGTGTVIYATSPDRVSFTNVATCGTGCSGINTTTSSPQYGRLTATPSASNMVFLGWSKDQTSGSSSFTFPIDPEDTEVVATFLRKPKLTLNINRNVTPGFTAAGAYVRVSSPNTTCPWPTTQCTYEYPNGTTSVVLTPEVGDPSACIEFKGWTGACTNTIGSCSRVMSVDRTVTARFGKKSGCVPQ